jgi:hypothetical protein
MNKLYIKQSFEMRLPDNEFSREINGALKVCDCAFVDDFLVIDCMGKTKIVEPENLGFSRDDYGWFLSRRERN